MSEGGLIGTLYWLRDNYCGFTFDLRIEDQESRLEWSYGIAFETLAEENYINQSCSLMSNVKMLQRQVRGIKRKLDVAIENSEHRDTLKKINK